MEGDDRTGDVYKAVESLQARFGARVSVLPDICASHGRDLSLHPGSAPDAVVYPETTEDVAEIVRLCSAYGAPMIPFGAGTSLEGHVTAVRGGISVDMSAMNSVLDVSQQDLDCLVEAGVTRQQLNADLRDTGLFFPVDPGAEATLGGMCATGASGTNAVRYGTMRENVLGLTVILPSGEIINTGGRARKSSAGYDLTKLFIGSEGTLGIITQIRLRLYGIPESVSAGLCAFETLEGAVNAVILTIQMGLPVARIELLDEKAVHGCNLYSHLELDEKPTLFLEFHGTAHSVKEQAERFGEIAAEYGGGAFTWATREEDRNRLWTARHNAFYAALNMRPGSKALTTDVCVPISRLADCILETKADIGESPMIAPLVGHVGDGNFHLVFLIDPDSAEEEREALRLNDRLIERALAMGGTCTGEHGIGLGKKTQLAKEHGSALGLMRLLKDAIDPQNLMNPGKITS